MYGLKAARIIRQRLPNGPKVIAVTAAITAYTLGGDREKFIEAGMDDYIAKPVKMDDLAWGAKQVSSSLKSIGYISLL